MMNPYYFFWNSRHNYLQILESFIYHDRDFTEFVEEFVQLVESNRNENEKIEVYFPTKLEHIQFTLLILSLNKILLLEVESRLNDLKSIENNDLSFIPSTQDEDFLKIYIKNKFFKKIRSYCNIVIIF